MKAFVRLMRNRAATFAIGFFLIFIAYQTVKVMYKWYETNSRIDGLRTEIAENLQKREQLARLQEMLSSDFFAEREARIKLGMQKEDERAVVLQQQDENLAPLAGALETKNLNRTVSIAATSEVHKKNPEQWRDFFFLKK